MGWGSEGRSLEGNHLENLYLVRSKLNWCLEELLGEYLADEGNGRGYEPPYLPIHYQPFLVSALLRGIKKGEGDGLVALVICNGALLMEPAGELLALPAKKGIEKPSQPIQIMPGNEYFPRCGENHLNPHLTKLYSVAENKQFKKQCSNI